MWPILLIMILGVLLSAAVVVVYYGAWSLWQILAGVTGGRKHGAPPTSRFHTTRRFGLLFASLLLVSLSTSGCSSSPKLGGGGSKLTTPQQIAEIQKPAQSAATFVNKALSLVDDMQAGKVAVDVALPQLHEQLVQAKAHIDEVNHALPEAEKSATSDAKTVTHQAEQIVALKKADPIKETFTWVGYGAFFGGLALVLGSFFIPALFKFIWLRTAGAGLIVFGLLTLTVVHFLTLIYWVCGGVLLAAALAGGFWLWTHRSAVKAKLKDDANWIPKPKTIEEQLDAVIGRKPPAGGT